MALWFAVMAGVLGCVSEPATGRLSAATHIDARSDAPATGGNSVRAERRSVEGCKPIEESLKYAEHVDRRALATLRWNGMSDKAADLAIPVYVVEIAGGEIRIRFLQFPMREQYLNIWLGSGHIRATSENVFLLLPCSARLDPWPYPEGR